MLRSTAARLEEFYSVPSDQISVDDVVDDREDFRDFLTERKYKKNSVRSYANYVGILIRLARQHGWTSSPSAVPPAWRIIAAECKRNDKSLLKYLVKNVGHPSAVREDDLRSWAHMKVAKGGSYHWTEKSIASMRKILLSAGYGGSLRVKSNRSKYAIRIELFPETLRTEVEDVIRWKVATFMPGRPRKAQIRPISADLLRGTFSRLYGFAVNVAQIKNIANLSDLVNADLIGRFIAWSLDERRTKGKTLSTKLGQVSAALARNPKYSGIVSDWMSALLNSIPEDSEEEVIRRKQEKFLPYEALRKIPGLIRRDRPVPANADPRTIALAVRDELLMQWLVTLPWRQRNLRELRIAGDAPNLQKTTLPVHSNISKPDWVLEAEKSDPAVQVWQFRFTNKETKTHHDVECVLPHSLVSLLEDYLTNHRRHLLRGADPGTLFLNDAGGPLRSLTLRTLVSELTLRYGGKIVTPHLFRDIFAFMWLELNPQDYLTLSKLLWHRNIQTTITIYGRKFNESAALCRMEKVLRL